MAVISFKNSSPAGFVEVRLGGIVLYSNKDFNKALAWVKLNCKLTEMQLVAMQEEYEKEG